MSSVNVCQKQSMGGLSQWNTSKDKKIIKQIKN
jgi:hypothetical protein